MNEATKQIMQNIKDTLPKLSVEDQKKLLAFTEGVAIMAEHKLKGGEEEDDGSRQSQD